MNVNVSNRFLDLVCVEGKGNYLLSNSFISRSDLSTASDRKPALEQGRLTLLHHAEFPCTISIKF